MALGLDLFLFFCVNPIVTKLLIVVKTKIGLGRHFGLVNNNTAACRTNLKHALSLSSDTHTRTRLPFCFGSSSSSSNFEGFFLVIFCVSVGMMDDFVFRTKKTFRSVVSVEQTTSAVGVDSNRYVNFETNLPKKSTIIHFTGCVDRNRSRDLKKKNKKKKRS